MKKLLSSLVIATMGVCGMFASFAARAQVYPSRPITMVVPFPVGGVVDNDARVLAKVLGDKLGQPIIVQNYGGAGGVIGVQAAQRARPDGYTILYGTSGAMVAVHSLMKSVPYNTLKDFIPVYGLAESPMVLVTRLSSPFKTLSELVAYAKKNPGKVTFGSPGLGTAPHLAGELLKVAANVDMIHVPYKGTAAASVDLLAGHIDLMFDYAAQIAPYVAAGTLRPLALSTASRLAVSPNVPTATELGYPQINLAPWAGLFVSAGTPKEVVDKLVSAIEAALKEPAMVENFYKGGENQLNLPPEKFVKFIKDELSKWKELIEKSGAVQD